MSFNTFFDQMPFDHFILLPIFDLSFTWEHLLKIVLVKLLNIFNFVCVIYLAEYPSLL